MGVTDPLGARKNPVTNFLVVSLCLILKYPSAIISSNISDIPYYIPTHLVIRHDTFNHVINDTEFRI